MNRALQQLTQEQAERCARACKWQRETTPHEYQWAPGHDAVTEAWWSCDGEWQGINPHPNFTDPYFWFPRLWQGLRDAAQGKGLQGCLLVGDCVILHIDQDLAKDCLVLCSAIEALEGK